MSNQPTDVLGKPYRYAEVEEEEDEWTITYLGYAIVQRDADGLSTGLASDEIYAMREDAEYAARAFGKSVTVDYCTADDDLDWSVSEEDDRWREKYLLIDISLTADRLAENQAEEQLADIWELAVNAVESAEAGVLGSAPLELYRALYVATEELKTLRQKHASHRYCDYD